MPRLSNRRWRPRFGLKTFLMFYLLGGAGVAWVSHSYSEYRAEQQLIRKLAERLSSSNLLTVATNGKTTCLVGNCFM